MLSVAATWACSLRASNSWRFLRRKGVSLLLTIGEKHAKKLPTQAKENDVASAAIASPSPSSTLKKTAPPNAASRPSNRSAMAKPQPQPQPQPKAAAPKIKVKVRRDKKVKYSFTMRETEHDAVVELKHKFSDAMGPKVKKSDLIRVALQLLQSQPQAKIKAGIVKLYEPTTTDSQNV